MKFDWRDLMDFFDAYGGVSKVKPSKTASEV